MTGEKYYAAVVENKGIFGVGTSEEGALLKAMANISKCAASSQAPFTGAVDVREIDEGLYHYILTVWDGYVTKEENDKALGLSGEEAKNKAAEEEAEQAALEADAEREAQAQAEAEQAEAEAEAEAQEWM